MKWKLAAIALLGCCLNTLGQWLPPEINIKSTPEADLLEFQKSCNQGDLCICNSLLPSLKACLKGEASGCGTMGSEYKIGTLCVSKELIKSAYYYRMGCLLHPGWCVDLGEMYLFGRGVEKNHETAMKLFERACDSGHIVGCREMEAAALPESNGKSPAEQDSGLLKEKCTDKQEAACYALGEMYADGYRLKKNRELSYHYFLQSCRLGLMNGCLQLKLSELHTACKQKVAAGCFALGFVYESGIWKPRQKINKRKALAYYRLSCEYGNAFGCEIIHPPVVRFGEP